MGRRKKKKKEQVYFCLDKRYKSRFSHSPLRCSRPKRRRSLSEGGVGGAAAPNAASQGLPSPPQQQEGQQFSSGPVTPGNGPHRPRAGPPRGPGAGQRQPQPAKGESSTAPPHQAHPPREDGRRQPPAHRAPPYPRRLSPPAAGPSLPTCPSAPPCYCGRGGGPAPAAASSTSPSASAAALPVPLPAPTGGGSGDAPPRPAAILRAARGGAFLPTS